jgi:hypothetical protein
MLLLSMPVALTFWASGSSSQGGRAKTTGRLSAVRNLGFAVYAGSNPSFPFRPDHQNHSRQRCLLIFKEQLHQAPNELPRNDERFHA